MQVNVSGNDVEKALKDLKRRLQRDGLFREIKKRSFYLKPSERMKQKQREAKRKRLKAQRFKSPQKSKPGVGTGSR
ncbi:MAG: 30S ribosomal protein S21 [Nitrospirae bacterium]|nr:30S ribosomal protein S21 [Nitrospirota bacterium]